MNKGQQELKQILLTRFRMRQLVAYIAVYEHRNIQAAAREMSLDHSTVSKSISEIEDILEMELFARHTRGVTPTPAADVLYRHARQIVNQCVRTAAELSRISSEPSTHLVIGCVSYLDTIAVRALAPFRAQQSGTPTVRLVFGRAKDLNRRLQLGEIDLVISRLGVFELQPDIETVHACEVDDLIAARADHPCAGRSGLPLAELVDYPWILPTPNTPFRSCLEGLFYEEGLPLPRDVLEIASMFAARDLLLGDSRIVCAVPARSLREDVNAGRITRLDVPMGMPPPPVGVLHRSGSAMQRSAEALAAAIRDSVA